MAESAKPIARWWTDEYWLYVRFENIPKTDFYQALVKFKQAISPEMEWVSDKRAWRLPKTDMQDVALVTTELFGDKSLYPLDEHDFRQPRLL